MVDLLLSICKALCPVPISLSLVRERGKRKEGGKWRTEREGRRTEEQRKHGKGKKGMKDGQEKGGPVRRREDL